MRLRQFTALSSLLLLVMLCLAACSSAKIALKDVPLPPGATREVFEGGFEVRLDLNAGEIQEMLREKFGAADVDIITLPDTMTWQDVLSFYQPVMEKDGWTVETDMSRSYRNYDLMVWTRGQQALAAAYMPEDTELPNNFLGLILTR